MANSKNIVARIKKLGRSASVLALALLLSAQLAAPAFAAQSGPAREGDMPEITQPEAPAPEAETPESDAPPEGETPPADEPPATVAAAGEVEAAADSDILLDGSPGHTWDDLVASGALILKTGGTLTIASGAGSPSTPVRILVQQGDTLEDKTATIDASGCGILENLRVHVQTDGLTLKIKNLKMRGGAEDKNYPAIGFVSYPEGDPDGGSGTLVFEGENEVYAGSTLAEMPDNEGADGIYASALTLSAASAASTLLAAGSNATAENEAGHGIYVVEESTFHDGIMGNLTVAADAKVTAKGGKAFGSEGQDTSDTRSGGHGVFVESAQVEIYGSLTGLGGDATNTSKTGGDGVKMDLRRGNFTTASTVALGATLTGVGGSSSPRDADAQNYSRAGNGIYFDALGGHYLSVAGTVNGTAGTCVESSYQSPGSTGVFVYPSETLSTAQVTGLASGKGAIGVHLYPMPAPKATDGHITATIEAGETVYGGTIAMQIQAPESAPDTSTYLMKGTFELAGESAVTSPGITTGTYGLFAQLRSDSSDSALNDVLKFASGSSVVPGGDAQASNIYMASGSMVIDEGASLSLKGAASRYHSNDLTGISGLAVTGNLTVNGTLAATGSSVEDQAELSTRTTNGPGVFVNGDMVVGSTARLTLSGGRTLPNQAPPVVIQTYKSTYNKDDPNAAPVVQNGAVINNSQGEPLYFVKLNNTGAALTSSDAFMISDGRRNYSHIFVPANHQTLYVMLPAQPSSIMRYPTAPCAPYDIQKNHTANEYSFNVANTAPALTGVTFGAAPATIKLNVGDTYQLTPQFTPSDTGRYLYWAVDDQKTYGNSAFTLRDGLVTAIANGSGTVTASTSEPPNYPSGKKAVVTIQVGDGPATPSVSISKGGSAYTGGQLPLGQTLQLSAVLANVSGSPTVTWTSSAANVATVEGGLVEPKALGTATIKAEITVSSKKYSASCDIEVVPAPLTSVRITPTGSQLAMGRSRTLYVEPNEGASLDGAAIAWDIVSSSPAGVVSLTPASDGKTATLKASDTLSGTATVQAVATPEGGSALPAATLSVTVAEGLGGVTFTQDYKVLPKSAAPVDITTLIKYIPEGYTPDNMTLATSNSKVVDVEKADGKPTGKIIAKALGAADITVEAWDEDDDERFQAVLTVKVAAPVTSLSLNASAKTLNSGATFQLKAGSAPANATLSSLAWSVEGPAGVVTVDESGLVTAVGPGTATVKATGHDLFGSAFTAACEVTVNHLAQGVSLTDADGNPLTPASVIILVPAAAHEDTELPGDRRFFSSRVILPVAQPASTTDIVSVKSSSGAVKATYSKDTGITLTGAKAGSATITVTLGKKKTTVKAQVVVPPASGENTGVKFKDPAAYAKDLAVNASRTLSLEYASRVSGAAPGKGVAWVSSNPAIATVAKGKVKAVAPGSVTITAASTVDSRAVATLTLKVVAPITAIKFNQANFPMEKGATETLSLTLNGGAPASTEDAALTKLTYNIDKPEVLRFVSLDGNTELPAPEFAPDGSFKVRAASVSAKATAKVTVKSPEKSATGYAQKTATLTVTVLPEAPVKATALTFTNKAKAPGATPLAVGKSFTPTAKVDKNASNKAVLWSIAATDGKPLDYVVFDAATGKVTGRAPSGSAELTVTGKPMWGDASVAPATFTFKVAKLVTSIGITGEKQMAVNARQTLTPTLTASATDLRLTWKSSNPAVVKVYNAAGDAELDAATAVAGPVSVAALKSGSATITATSPDAGKKKVTFKITVVQQVEKVEIVAPAKYLSGANAAMDRGQSMTLKPKFLNAAGTAVIKPKNTKVSWSIVSNPSGAITLSPKGVVKGMADGTALVRVTSQDGGKTAELSITVTAKATAVAMNQTSFKMYSGNTRTLTLNATTTPLLGQLSDGHDTLKWTIADSSRLIFDANQGAVTSEGGKSVLTTMAGIGAVRVKVNPAITITENQTLKCDVSVATVSGKTKKITVSIVGKEAAAPMAKGISVKKSTWLGVGKKETLKVTFTPGNAANKNLRWAVYTDAACTTLYTGNGITVSAKGQVAAKAAGTYYVRAESVDGEFRAVCAVYVVPKN